MQFFVVLPVLVFCYLKNRMAGYALIVVLLVMNIVTTFVLSHVGHHNILFFRDSAATTEIYVRPYTRIGAYLIGVLYGLMYYEFKTESTQQMNAIGYRVFKNIQNNQTLRLILYVLGGSIMVGLVFTPYSEMKNLPSKTWSQIPTDFYLCVNRILFTIGMAMLLCGPIVGKGSIFRYTLGSSVFAPWAKLTFMAYLVHIQVLCFFYTQQYQGVYLTKRFIAYTFFAAFIVTYLVTIPLTLLLESPVLQLERLILFPPSNKEKSLKIDVRSSQYHQLKSLEEKDSKKALANKVKINYSIDETTETEAHSK